MEAYANVLSYAVVGFFILIIIEYTLSRIMGKTVYHGMDTVSSLSSGITNTIKSLVGLSVVIVSYDFLVGHLALFQIKSELWLYVLAFIGIDFASYWSHRFNHEINLFWNRHIVHHSSEEFNLACALRQSISSIVGIYFFLYIPLAFIGIPTEIIAVTAPLHLFAQFWYHTRLIDKMGFLEYIIVTPSHHRVHHAINPEYIDKNYAAIFIIWDRLFGTFQEELEDVPAVYGTKSPVRTWNPVLINYLHLWGLIKDAWRTKSWRDKYRIWYMPTGWRPSDVAEKYPIYTVENVFEQQKYAPPISPILKGWIWVHFIIVNVLLTYWMLNIANIEYLNMLWYAAFLMLTVFAYTTLMDGHQLAVPVELLKLIVGGVIIYRLGDWFAMDAKWFAGATIAVIIYMSVSFILTIYFLYIEEKPKPVTA